MTVRLFHIGRLPACARRPRLIRKACLSAIKSEGLKGRGELNIIFVDREGMLALNKRFLRHNYDTDVIAFSYSAEERARDSPFGDIYISAFQARRQAREIGHPVLREILTLVIHGTLHLLGYRDDAPRRQAEMFKKQDEILRRSTAIK